MNNILIIAGRYLPGYKDGGPVRTIKNLTDLLGDRYHFTIMCADRDHGDNKPYDNVIVSDDYNESNLNHVGSADVLYVKDGRFRFSAIKKAASQNDVVYILGPYNSYAIKTLILNRTGRIKSPVVLAPMGSFSKGALAIKSTKKKLFFTVTKLFNLFKNISFSVTSEVEKSELTDALAVNNKCYIAKDPQRKPGCVVHDKFKENGILNVVFLSRICEKKNLLGAVEILGNVQENVSFSIYGNLEDESYYKLCLDKLKTLPENISWEYKGIADSEEVPEILSHYDVFLFPTQGENFGHVISEALSAGVIPVISDTTPWLDFDKSGAGYVIDHSDIKAFSDCIDKLASMDELSLKRISANVTDYYLKQYNESIINNGYTEMFDELL